MDIFNDHKLVNKGLRDLATDYQCSELDELECELDNKDEEALLEHSESDYGAVNNLEMHEEHKYFAAVLPGLNLSEISKKERSTIKISDQSSYTENRWVLKSSSIEVSLIFSKEKYGSNEMIDFVKAFLYYSIPENHPTGRVKSLKTTIAYQGYLRALIMYLFDEHAINNLSRDIRFITLDQLNRSLDKARTISYSIYGSLFYVYAHWFTLNEHGLLPEEYILPCERNHLLTRERRTDVFNFISSQAIGWQPFSEIELTGLVHFIIPQLERGKEKIFEIATYADENDISDLEQSSAILEMVSELDELITSSTMSSSPEEHHLHLKDKPVQRIIKNFRQALFSFLALITGLRRRELNALMFSHFEAISDTTCRLSVTRWKTSDVPSDGGTKDDVYLPIMVYESVDALQKIAISFYNCTPTHLAYNHNDATTQKKDGFGYDLVQLGQKLGINLHPHRFRKTIASLLIMQNERNIELIRFLFGHKSYAMTMHYVMRNPFLVEDITRLMEYHYCQEFSGLLSEILSGHYSGKAAEQIAINMRKNKAQFSGELLHTTIKEYVSAMLKAGEPLFIHRIPLGGTCVSVPILASRPTPCTKNMKYSDRVKPDITMCESEMCPKAAFTRQSLPALLQNIKYYESILEHHSTHLPTKLSQKYERLLYATKVHVTNIESKRPIKIEVIQVDHV